MRPFLLTILGFLCLESFPLNGEDVHLDARFLHEKSVTQGIRLGADDTALELDEGELFEDDGPAAGYSYKPNEERLSSQTWIKKELVIPDPRARTATLLVGSGGDLKATINGKAVDLKLKGKAGGYWQTYLLPPSVLKPGKNTIVLSGSGRVWIARNDEFAAGSRSRRSHPNRSAKSSDGGKTWDYDRLGSNGSIDGEYCVRLFLGRHLSRGTLTLPVLDAGNCSGAVIAPTVSLAAVRINVDAQTGAAGAITLRVRSGSTPVPDNGWSKWQIVKSGEKLTKLSGRYLQVALELRTTDPLHSPKLKQITIEATTHRSSDWVKGVRVVESHNADIVRSSIPFEYEPFDHPALKELRTRYKLDEVVKGAKGEFDLITRLASWSAQRWNKGHLREAYPSWNALDILRPHRDGTPVGGFCQQHNLVFLQACESFGIPGRAVSIGPGDHGARIRGGHEVVEVWSNEHRKWVYVDGDAAWYLQDAATKTPLSLWELRQRQIQTSKGMKASPVEVVKLPGARRDWKGLDGWPPFYELRLIPRSNFLQKKSPLPLNQGMRGWFWTGHHVWTDTLYPASQLYGRRVSKRGNWEWTLNQAQFTLEATDTKGTIRVHLDTETPGFDTFVAILDGGKKTPVHSGFLWKLQPGKNSLAVWPRNTLGRDGITSRVVLRYQP